jgi:hypothetical protein
VYVIGDWLGTGVQWSLFRYQQSYLGDSLILVSRDIVHVTSGVIVGRSAISLLFWIAGSVLILIAFILAILATIHEEPAHFRKGALLTITGGLFLLLSIMVQYGITFSGPAGFAVPVGIPIILIIGWLVYSGRYEDAESVQGPE